jgi:hypothetical protein
MRKILFSLSVILLLCFSANAQEYDYCAGASGATSCGVTDHQDTGGYGAIVGWDTTFDRKWVVSSFTAAGNAEIKTAYVNMKYMVGNDSGITFTGLLCPDATGVPAVDASCAESTNTVALSSLGATYASTKFQFAGYSITASTKYWLKIRANTINAAKYAALEYYNTATGHPVLASPDDADYASVVYDASGQFLYSLTTCAE